MLNIEALIGPSLILILRSDPNHSDGRHLKSDQMCVYIPTRVSSEVAPSASKPRSLEASKPLAWLIRKKEIRKEETERKKDQKESESSTDGDLLNTEQTGYRTERLVILFIRTFSSHVCRDRTSVSIQTTISSQPGPEHRTEPALEQMYINVYTEYSRDLQTTDKEVRS